ncbi:hypothetical protein L2719_11100 [Shewanella schlegeliana]|uniref:Uncharacterized protein n=1 Tax=Shewanella schlegeliana TaxID=190308 RepID=A0ABS1STU0_9GAMM|nr:hypothetical protein [Shewanella schlegeliana]MBL4911953.1 hypothetical protein [Shewanella schlegeliana]MCL1110094.1 hypothetical protein [Shewanella schlegeliana]GIU26725.1 hypothetical protein TUM4433_12880 [Shewanella schlegeliana]
MKQAFSMLMTGGLIFLSGCSLQPNSHVAAKELAKKQWQVNQHENHTVSAVGKTVKASGHEVIAQLDNYLDGRYTVKLTENMGQCSQKYQVAHNVDSIILVGNKYIKAVRTDTCVDGTLFGEYVFFSGFSKLEDKKLSRITYALFNGLEIAGVSFEPAGVKQVMTAFSESNRILSYVSKT